MANEFWANKFDEDGRMKIDQGEIVAPGIENAGVYQALAAANVDPGGIAVPAGAVGVILFFEASATDESLVRGRVGFDASEGVVAGISANGTKLGHQPPTPVQYRIREGDTHLHVACHVAGAVCRGMWLFA